MRISEACHFVIPTRFRSGHYLARIRTTSTCWASARPAPVQRQTSLCHPDQQPPLVSSGHCLAQGQLVAWPSASPTDPAPHQPPAHPRPPRYDTALAHVAVSGGRTSTARTVATARTL